MSILDFRAMSAFSSKSGIGVFSQHKMKKVSPYATLLLDISQGLREEEISEIKLVLNVDKKVRRRQLEKMRNGAEVLSCMYDEDLISSSDTHYLESLLHKFGRKDLCTKIEKYHMKRNAQLSDDSKASIKINNLQGNTTPKQLYNPYMNQSNLPVYTSLKVPQQPASTCYKELHVGVESGQPIQYSSTRSSPDGLSANIQYCPSALAFRREIDQDGLHALDSNISLQSDIEMSQKSSQSSQMSISDDEKLNYSQEKTSFDGILAGRMQLSQ